MGDMIYHSTTIPKGSCKVSFCGLLMSSIEYRHKFDMTFFFSYWHSLS